MSDKIKISVVIPCFNEEEVLPLFYDNLMDVSKIKVTAIKNSNPAGEISPAEFLEEKLNRGTENMRIKSLECAEYIS